MSLIAKHPGHGKLPSAIEVAREFFVLARAEKSPGFTAYKLQKLLYYAQAISQRDRGRGMFWEAVKAWDNGPVVACVYHEISGMKTIPYTHENLGCPAKLNDQDRELVLAVWERFKHLSGDELKARSHKDQAYIDARKQKTIFNQNPTIQPEGMRADIERDRSHEAEQFEAFMAGIQAGA